nr:uncharacterized protein LOC129437481 isoform X2 [Misgurnus anguillicaudatus]XP_055051617.1 uncharacterized protein LOC129437481 isoform X2 [Misgurnus anguillicaudatus]
MYGNTGVNMAVNDHCRLCKVNLRIYGTINASKLIFDSREKEESICRQLSKLGLVLLNTPVCSYRVCRKCCNVIARLQRDMEIFKEWKTRETLTCQNVASSSSTDKRDRDTPSKTPRSIKKQRKSTDLPSRSSVTEIIISYERKDRRIICQSDVAGIVENLGKKNFGRAANLISRHRELMEYLKSSVLDIVEDECKKLCNPQHHFMLWRTSSSDLQKFSFTELFEDLKRLSPFIFSMIAKMAKDSLPHICTAASVALRGRNPRLSALAYYVDAVLLYGGAKKAVFQRLGKLGISTIHQSAVGKQKELAHNCKPPVFSLKKDLESYLSSQVTNISEQERTLKVSTSISSCPGEPTKQPTEVVDVRDVFTFSALSDEDMADLGVVPLSVPALPATSIPHTYSIVFDNLDFFIRTHHQSTNQTNKSIHWIHHMCVIDRIPSLHLPNTKPANSLSDYDLGESLPGQHTQACMRREFVVLGSRILTSYLEVLKPFASAVVHHIPHLYTDEMAQTSTHFPLGLLFKNENKTGDLVDVLQHIQKEYVARCPDGLEKILVGGDRLTEGNSRNVQWAFADGETEEDRLEGLVFKFEDWHAIRNLFEIYHQIFFDENSAKDHGTLLSNMNLLR